MSFWGHLRVTHGHLDSFRDYLRVIQGHLKVIWRSFEGYLEVIRGSRNDHLRVNGRTLRSFGRCIFWKNRKSFKKWRRFFFFDNLIQNRQSEDLETNLRSEIEIQNREWKFRKSWKNQNLENVRKVSKSRTWTNGF